MAPPWDAVCSGFGALSRRLEARPLEASDHAGIQAAAKDCHILAAEALQERQPTRSEQAELLG